MRTQTRVALGVTALCLASCASRFEKKLRSEFEQARPSDWTTQPTTGAVSRDIDLNGELPAYLAAALQRSPEVQAAYARWEVAIHQIARARRLPEPNVSFGIFVRTVETRVGPQQARISLQQAFPWPSKLRAGADAASSRAVAAQRRCEAEALTVAHRVAEAFWTVWQIRRTRVIHAEHLEVIRGLSETVRARIATGQATLAEQQQIDLNVARVADAIAGMDEEEFAAEARLRAAVGLPERTEVPTTEQPVQSTLPKQTDDELIAYALRHPTITVHDARADAAQWHAKAERADRFPSFTVGVDWIITGQASDQSLQDSGKDAVIVGAGVRLPLWQKNYGESIKAARAQARVARADRMTAVHGAHAQLAGAQASVRDAVRRVNLYRGTLLPQAESAYASVLGAYTTGQATVAQTLLAQRDLLQLHIELERAHADYGRAWARLEHVVGRSLERGSPTVREVP